jgi:hypothetical membrane protein
MVPKIVVSEKVVRALLVCGIIAALIYIATDLIAAMLYQGYSYADQTISELSAIGAPTRQIWIAMSFLFNPLLVAFGIGVRKAAGDKRRLRITGILLAVWGALGFVWLLFPMHMRGAIGSTTDAMHLVMAGVTVPLMISFIALGSGARGKWFRLYSISTIAAMLVFGAYTGTQAARVQEQLPTPWLGIAERISVYSPMLWILVLAIVLLRGSHWAYDSRKM